MLESMERFFDVEDFPEITFILAAIMLAVFLFTNSNIPFYENLFGFIPARPQVWSFTTYIFIHANFTHLFFNLLFLIVGGIAIEETLGKWAYLSVFFASGYIAVIFDILGRFLGGFFDFTNKVCAGSFLSCVNLGGPFVGASGAIFGIMAVASLIKPAEKIPTILVLLAFIPFIQTYWEFQSHYSFFTTIFVTTFVAILAMTIFFVSPGTVPIFVGMLCFMFSWIFVIFLNASGNVSNVGHLGGVIGGLVSYFIFAKRKST
jgi:membrane associated rhomboid family serine protease